jgi:hypothetical protein
MEVCPGTLRSSLDRSKNQTNMHVLQPRGGCQPVKMGLLPRHPFKGHGVPPPTFAGGGSPHGPLNKNQNGTLISTTRIVLTCVNRSEGCFEVTSWHVYVVKSPKVSPRSPPTLLAP